MRIVCLSDTHNQLGKIVVPPGDLLIHAGDLTGRGRFNELAQEVDAIARLPHKHKVVIAGNHDLQFENSPSEARHLMRLRGITYLEDMETTVGGLRIWGSPWSPTFGWGWAFNADRGERIRAKWRLIPDGIDILVTHGPPFGYGDHTSSGERAGCEDLMDRIAQVRPKLHVFGHFHGGTGIYRWEKTLLVNAANANERYEMAKAPIVLDWDGERILPVAQTLWTLGGETPLAI